MEALTDEDRAKLSRTELRKQKLAEYLAAKGRLKPPNPRPYLKDPGAVQKIPLPGKGKENSISSSVGVKDVKVGKALAEKNKNSASITTSKLTSLPRASSTHLQRLPLKPAMHQPTHQHPSSRVQLKGTTTVKNVKEQQTKPVFQTIIRPHKQSKTVKTDPESVSSKARPISRSFKDNTSNFKTEVAKKRLVTAKESGSEKIKPNVKCPMGTRTLANPSITKTKTLTMPRNTDKSTVGISCTKPVRAQSDTDNKKPLKPDRSETLHKKQTLNKEQNKKELTVMQKTVPGMYRTKSSQPAFSKTETAGKSINAALAGDKRAVMQQRRTTFQLPPKPTIQVPVPQTLPRSTKSFTIARESEQPKTPKSTFKPDTNGVRTVPLDGRNKPNAAQEERLRKLQEWRERKGVTYKRPPMPVQPLRRKTTALPPQSYWTSIEQEDEVHGFVCAVDQSLNDCIKLLQQGCPVDQVRDVLSRVPMAQKFAKYWICQVRLMEREGNLDVLPTFEEAVREVRESVDELRSVVFEILKKKESKASSLTRALEEDALGSEETEEHKTNMCTPKPVGALIRGERGDSSVIKFKITNTPGQTASRQDSCICQGLNNLEKGVSRRRNLDVLMAMKYVFSLQCAAQ
ncbi:cytoskeleton-associated protein 2-like isoform X2 [Trichomycterus rosablanca]|uniref:cytoskeleton-associated protein 2-like isoform X2 n=1 Tax=Trichomycterus rosablanca TaxID=2290929 RepID=UPI002F3562E3